MNGEKEGKEFDSSRKSNGARPLKFTLGKGEVIKAGPLSSPSPPWLLFVASYSLASFAYLYSNTKTRPLMMEGRRTEARRSNGAPLSPIALSSLSLVIASGPACPPISFAAAIYCRVVHHRITPGPRHTSPPLYPLFRLPALPPSPPPAAAGLGPGAPRHVCGREAHADGAAGAGLRRAGGGRAHPGGGHSSISNRGRERRKGGGGST